MKKVLFTGAFFFVFIITNYAHPQETRVELANLTVQYYNFLSTKNFNALAEMLDEPFCIDGLIQFQNRTKTIDFFKKTYGNGKQDIELLHVLVFNHHNILDYKQKEKQTLNAYKKLTKPGDWVTLISKIKVDGKVTSVNVGLIFSRKNNKWLIKGMYQN